MAGCLCAAGPAPPGPAVASAAHPAVHPNPRSAPRPPQLQAAARRHAEEAGFCAARVRDGAPAERDARARARGRGGGDEEGRARGACQEATRLPVCPLPLLAGARGSKGVGWGWGGVTSTRPRGAPPPAQPRNSALTRPATLPPNPQLPTPHGPNSTDYKKWFSTDQPYAIRTRTEYEPWFLIDRHLNPFYDSAFRGYGWNKVTHVANVLHQKWVPRARGAAPALPAPAALQQARLACRSPFTPPSPWCAPQTCPPPAPARPSPAADSRSWRTQRASSSTGSTAAGEAPRRRGRRPPPRAARGWGARGRPPPPQGSLLR
jgi:hypothetical protein